MDTGAEQGKRTKVGRMVEHECKDGASGLVERSNRSVKELDISEATLSKRMVEP